MSLKNVLMFSLIGMLMLIGSVEATGVVVASYDFDTDTMDSVHGVESLKNGNITFSNGAVHSSMNANGDNWVNVGYQNFSTDMQYNFSIYFDDIVYNTQYIGIMGSYADSNNSYVLYLENATNTVFLRSEVNGVSATSTVAQITRGQWYTMSIQIGSLGRYVYVDDVLCVNSTTGTQSIYGMQSPSTMSIFSYPWDSPRTSMSGSFDNLIIKSVGRGTQTLSYQSSYDSTSPLYADVTFDSSLFDVPMLVVCHGYESNRTAYKERCEQYVYKNATLGIDGDYFALACDMRGRPPSAGISDRGGIELIDILDAIDFCDNDPVYSQLFSSDALFLYGTSFGGENSYMLASRYPEKFKAVAISSGVADVAKWYYSNPSYQPSLRTRVGGSPENISYRYYARSPYNTSSGINCVQNIQTPIIAFHSDLDAVVSSDQMYGFQELVEPLYPYDKFYSWDNFSHGGDNPAAQSIIDDFLQLHKNDEKIDYSNANLTIPGYLVTDRFDISLFNHSTGDIASDIGYIDLANADKITVISGTPLLKCNFSDGTVFGSSAVQSVSDDNGNSFETDDSDIQSIGRLIPTGGDVNFQVMLWAPNKKIWNETSESPDISVTHILGDLPADTNIAIYRDGEYYETVTTNSTGYIEWTYSGGFSEHEFSIETYDFDANSLSGTAPLSVQFSNASENVTSWYWDFENDGKIDSTKQNPVNTYSTPGNYSVNLTINDGFGNFSTVKTDYITVSAPAFTSDPVAWFGWVLRYLSSIYVGWWVAA